MIRQGRYVDVPARPAALLEPVGFVVQHCHQAMLTAREAPWTLDGGEERHRHFLRRVHTKRNAHVAINSEGVLCAEEAREPGWRSRGHTPLEVVRPGTSAHWPVPTVILFPLAVPISLLASDHLDTYRERTGSRSTLGAIATRHTAGRDAARYDPQGSGAASEPTGHQWTWVTRTSSGDVRGVCAPSPALDGAWFSGSSGRLVRADAWTLAPCAIYLLYLLF
jgi:hypothetical protein